MIPEEIKGSYAPKPDDKQMSINVPARYDNHATKICRRNIADYHFEQARGRCSSLGTARFNDKLRTQAQRKQGPVRQSNMM